jgi:hypothetical protein
MPAKITLANPTSSVTAVKLRAGVVVVSPVVSESNQYPVVATSAQIAAAAVTHVYPVSDISYILLASSAYLDTTGLFKFTADSVTVVENTAFVVSKIADADSFYLADSTETAFGKAASDSVTMSDSVVTVTVFIRDFAETISLADSATRLVSPAYIETVFTSDAKVLAFSIGKADSFSLSDFTAVVYSPAYSDTVSSSDATTLSTDKLFSETMSTSDSGSLIAQNYCDITYFAEDYVGESRTF